MDHPSLHDPRRIWRIRYDDLTTNWDRIALERYAIRLTRQEALQGATKIRLVKTILDAEMDGWPHA